MLVVHRWLGVLVGAVMTIWCLSGFVMMYADYPRLTGEAQLRGLAPARSPDAATLARVELRDDARLASVRVETMAGRAVLRVVPAAVAERRIAQQRAAPSTVDLGTGRTLTTVGRADVRRVAETFARESGIAGGVRSIAATGIDQWTVQTFRRNRPLYRADFADAAGTTIYISGRSGEVVQHTTRRERFWGWLGAVPHWLYPTMLRQDGAAWAQVVIWTSLLGCFLTVTGLWVGVARLRRGRDGRLASPYKRLWWWHHMAGLFFGVLVLTWVASGLLSMNPWGLLGRDAGGAARERLSGAMRWGDVRAAIGAMTALPADTRRIESAPLNGRVYLLSVDHAGVATRFDAAAQVAALRREDIVAALRRGPALGSLRLIAEEDSYYYGHKRAVTLPVWRAILRDAETTRLYIDPETGALIQAANRDARLFRWLQDGAHRLDLPGLRARPYWDVIVLVLLSGVTMVCATGMWMGLRKAKRDMRRWLRLRRRRVA